MRNRHVHKPERKPFRERLKDFRLNEKKLTREDRSRLYTMRRNISMLFGFIALIQFVPTLILPLGATSDGLVIYTRNFTSVSILILLGIYLFKWGDKSKSHDHKQMTVFTFLTLAVSLACFAKALLTGYYFYRLNMDFNFAGFYYIGELVLWAVMAVYFLYYFIILLKRRNKNQEHQKTVSNGK